MSLVIILLALLVERVAVFIHPIREHHWFEHYSQKTTLLMRKNAYLSLPLSLIPILAIVLLVHIFLAGPTFIGFGWASWIFDLIVLIYCLGNTHLKAQVRECYEQIELGNIESARALLLEHFDVVQEGNISAAILMKAMYRASLQRIFAILFWFTLLGPVGAVLYRFVQKLSVYESEEVMDKVKTLSSNVTFVLDWIPARLLALSFCLAGHFMDVFVEWQKTFKIGLKETYQVLYHCGHKAIGGDVESDSASQPSHAAVLAQIDEAYHLICRSLFIWLVVLALVILF